MFKFSFASDQSKQDLESTEDNLKHLLWLPSKEVLICDAITIKNNEASDFDIINVGSEKLHCVKQSIILKAIKEKKSDVDENILSAEQNHLDLIPSIYEGGLKVWECTHDIAGYLDPSQLEGKTVLDLGCGVGLLGILALKLGAQSVCFQDYNSDVLRYATIQNVQLNADSQQVAACRFFSGDWESFAQLSQLACDLILTSETIYNPTNYAKLHDTIQTVLKPNGTALVGAKSYYFGVGGSTRHFEKMVHERGVFNVDIIWKCCEGVQREILKLTFKNMDS